MPSLVSEFFFSFSLAKKYFLLLFDYVLFSLQIHEGLLEVYCLVIIILNMFDSKVLPNSHALL